jgi:broad specificity phosphatase PhoE
MSGASTTRLLLARHAETVWHAENRYAGARTDPELTEAGLRQAEVFAKGVAAAGVEVVVSSTQRRAVRSAEPAAAALGVALHRVPQLREVDFGSAEGQVLTELDADVARRFVADPAANPFPGAEPPSTAARRITAALRGIATQYTGAAVLVVGHSTVLRIGLCALLGLPIGRYRSIFPRLDNLAVTEIRLPDDPAQPAALLSLNQVLPS